jgi:mono/diheme cytochrome c family protein
MNKILLSTALLLTTLSSNAALLPGDAANGKKLHGEQCVACHDTSVYTRANRRVRSVEALVGQVQGCVRQTGAKLDREQVNDIIRYLDESFYEFK